MTWPPAPPAQHEAELLCEDCRAIWVVALDSPATWDEEGWYLELSEQGDEGCPECGSEDTSVA